MPTKLRPIGLTLVVLAIMALPATHRSSGKAAGNTTAPAPTFRPASQDPWLCRGESIHDGWWGPVEVRDWGGDVVLAFDTSAGAASLLTTVQTQAEAIVDRLLAANTRVGVIAFRDYPTDPYGEPSDVFDKETLAGERVVPHLDEFVTSL